MFDSLKAMWSKRAEEAESRRLVAQISKLLAGADVASMALSHDFFRSLFRMFFGVGYSEGHTNTLDKRGLEYIFSRGRVIGRDFNKPCMGSRHNYCRLVFPRERMFCFVDYQPDNTGCAEFFGACSKEIRHILADLSDFEIQFVPPHINKFHVVVQDSQNAFGLRAIELDAPDIDFSCYYGTCFQDINSRITDMVRDDRAGVFLFSGPPGTGKSTYIKHLALSNEVDKSFIIVPKNVTGCLADPGFINTLMKFRGSVLVVEDAESIVELRDPRPAELSNILNLGDGILGDAVKLKIILTFNADCRKVDPALKRWGRLLYHHEFTPLEKSCAMEVARRLGKKIEIEDSMVLADIFNTEDNCAELRGGKVERRVGFA